MRLPWQREGGTEERVGDEPPEGEPVLSCQFQDGTLAVYENAVYVDRSSRSKFADKLIPIDEVRDLAVEKRLVISYVQIEQLDFENSEGSFFTTPVGENTLHFGRGKRKCARRAREEILDRAGID